MPRLIRLLEKKRGDRRTGSNLVGSVGEALFYGALFLLGVTALAALLTAHVVQPATAWYAVGVGFWCMVLVLTSFVMIGGAGALRTSLRIGFSAERRSAIAQSANEIDLVRQTVPSPKDFPTLPSHEGLTNSPGTELAYRLPASNTSGWRLLATTIFSLLWNAIGCVLVVIAARGWLDGSTNWLLSLFLLPVAAVGGASIYFVLRQIWIDAGMGPTAVEICSHPLFPGQRYEVHISQSGQMRVDAFSVWLECEEEVTYHQGTDIRREVRTVYESRLFESTGFQIEPGMPFQMECAVPIPAGAMHSFQSEHNAVHWRLVIHASPAYWPAFERRFPIIVYPSDATQRAAEAEAAAVTPAARSSPALRPPHERRSVLSEVTA